MATDRPASIAAKLPRSRLCCSTHTQDAPGQPYLFEALRELAFENCVEVAGITLRFGLAASAWQLDQARVLLEHFQPAGQRKLDPVAYAPTADERAVALALHVSPRHKSRHAQGVITLRRDSAAGLTLDATHHELLDELRARGACLVEVEQLAFDLKAPRIDMLAPMIQALANTIKEWGATDILAECIQAEAGFYCSRLGFKRLMKRPEKKNGKVLLHLPARRIERFQNWNPASSS